MNATHEKLSARFLLGMCAILLFLLSAMPSESATTRTWKAATTGDWSEAGNWIENIVPADGDDVYVTNTGSSVVLSSSALNLSSITLSATLTFTNWTTQLGAANVRVMAGGVMTCSGPFIDGAMSNRVNILCTNLILDADAFINVDACGWAGAITSGDGNGAGKGKTTSYNRATGGSYGGIAGYIPFRQETLYVMPPCGSASAPVDPGSGGGLAEGVVAAGNGGGAVRIDAGGTVTVNGAISAEGGSTVAVNGGPGSGGSIYISCAAFTGTGGVVRARGGRAHPDLSGGGGGGRIAVIYTPSAQALQPVPSVLFQAAGGGGYFYGDLGTIYLPDSQFLTTTISSNFSGQLLGVAAWHTNNLTISNTWIRFATDGFQLTVDGDFNILGGAGTRVDIGGDAILAGAVLNNSDIRGWYLFHNSGTSRPALKIGGSLVVTNQATLYVYSVSTNATVPGYGALVSITGDVVCASNSWIYPISNPTNGGSPYFTMANLTILTNGGIDADHAGFKGGLGYGKGTESGARGGGAGYGGSGGPGPNGAGTAGGTYGSSNAPVDAGSGGGLYNGTRGGRGGGVARITANGNVTMNGGSITANGEGHNDADGGGSGGSVYLACRRLDGTGTIAANGGAGDLTYSGGGGGGRIALYRYADYSIFSGSVTADGAAGWSNGAPGTIVFYDVTPPPSGTVFIGR